MVQSDSHPNFSVEGVTVTSFVPKVFEVGKPATIGCDFIYDDKDKKKEYKDENVYQVDSRGSLLNFDTFKKRANKSHRNNKIRIMFKELRYEDHFIFICESTTADFKVGISNIEIGNATIKVHNVQGNVYNDVFNNMNDVRDRGTFEIEDS